MQIIDAHVHLLDEPGYLDNLLRTMDQCGIEQCCLSGLGPLFRHAGNGEVAAAIRSHPDRVIGAVYVRPGVDAPDLIDWGYEQGFRMVKITLPRGPYDDPAFHPLWERALSRRMPVLFHSGVVTTAVEVPGEGVSAWNMHPMRIEPITREFPDLGVIVAHLGVHWNTDAAELARMRPNVYVDLTGEPHGWRARADNEGFDRYLWWPTAFDKVVFGTVVHYSKIKIILEEDRRRMESCDVPESTRERIFSGNIRRLLGIDSTSAK